MTTDSKDIENLKVGQAGLTHSFDQLDAKVTSQFEDIQNVKDAVKQMGDAFQSMLRRGSPVNKANQYYGIAGQLSLFSRKEFSQISSGGNKSLYRVLRASRDTCAGTQSIVARGHHFRELAKEQRPDAQAGLPSMFLYERHTGMVTRVDAQYVEVTYELSGGEVVRQTYAKDKMGSESPELGETVEAVVSVFRKHDADLPIQRSDSKEVTDGFRNIERYSTSGPVKLR